MQYEFHCHFSNSIQCSVIHCTNVLLNSLDRVKTYVTVISCTEDILFTYRIAFVLAQAETQFDRCGLGGAVVEQATLGRGSMSDLSPASGCQPKPELSLSPDLWEGSETLGTYIAWCGLSVNHPEPTTRAGDARADWWELQIGTQSFHLGWLSPFVDFQINPRGQHFWHMNNRPV